MPAALLPLLILILLRLLFLDARPIHHDEAVNGWFIDGVFQRGYFIYDPANYHGPWFFYWTALSESIFGRNLIALRIPAVLFGALLTLVPFLYRRWIGLRAAFLGSFLLAISPAVVFFSRYAIHESAFAFFSALFAAIWLLIREDGWSVRRAIGLGITLAALAGLKENFVLLGAAILLAEGVMALVMGGLPEVLARRNWKFVGGVFLSAFVLVGWVFTAGGRDPAGVSKFFEAFFRWTETGAHGNGHEKPFYYWVAIMGRFEWPALLGLILIPFRFAQASVSVRWTGMVGVFLLLIYSAIRYKTPWCILSFSWALVIFAASTVIQWLESPSVSRLGRRIWVTALVIASGVSIVQIWDVAYGNPDQDGHPYVYGQTYSEMIPQVDAILENARNLPGGASQARVQVVSGVTWPLPYLLGELKKVGYYSETNAPTTLDADFIILDESLVERFRPRFAGDYSKACVRSRQWAPKICFFGKDRLMHRR